MTCFSKSQFTNSPYLCPNVRVLLNNTIQYITLSIISINEVVKNFLVYTSTRQSVNSRLRVVLPRPNTAALLVSPLRYFDYAVCRSSSSEMRTSN